MPLFPSRPQPEKFVSPTPPNGSNATNGINGLDVAHGANGTNGTNGKHGSKSLPASKTVLSSDVSIKGTVKFRTELVIDGKVEGTIDSVGRLTVGKNAHIRAKIKTRSVTIHGTVEGK